MRKVRKAIAGEQDFSNVPDELLRHAKVDAGFMNDAALPSWSFFHVYNAHLVLMLSDFQNSTITLICV
jgi:hypothetical protein